MGKFGVFMRLVKSSCEVIPQKGGLEGLYELAELVGRVSYKSEDKITSGSAKSFVDRLAEMGHGTPLEHATVYLSNATGDGDLRLVWYKDNPYSKFKAVTLDDGGEGPVLGFYVTTDLRVLIENDRLSDLQYLCEPTEHHEKRFTVKFVCDRAVSHELVRHRKFSFMQESQRYCNYTKDKFGGVTFIIPTWLENDIEEGDYSNWDKDWCHMDNLKVPVASDKPISDVFIANMKRASYEYHFLLNSGLKAQMARAVLPNATKTEVYMTGFESDWGHFFELRCVGSAHPDMQKLAKELYFKLYGRHYWGEK